MTNRRKKWLIAAGVAAAFFGLALSVTAYVLARRFEPYVRDQAISYLQNRFDSEVELSELRIRMPRMASLMFLLGGHGAVAGVEGESIVLRHKGRRDVPPMFLMKAFSFDVDLGTLLSETKVVHRVTLDGMAINIPPKGERPELHSGPDNGSSSNILFEEVIITNSALTILPRDSSKTPLRFGLHRVLLESAGMNMAMKYDADLTNAKPPGKIQSTGTFGPWLAVEPGDSPVGGEYRFDNADLGVFSSIAGILNSTGQFEGTLSSLNVKGQASVPDFRLKRAGNPVALKTQFEVLVDGSNGNTILKPVIGTLGSTTFTTSGGIIKHEADVRRSISLDVSMPAGNLRDLLTLAMKGSSFMEGQISLNAKIEVPPLTGKVRERLILDGQFEISQGKFLRSTIQDQIDTLSRRGQGQPENRGIDEVVSAMAGTFHFEDEVMTFRSLSFAVPGSGVDLTGSYDLDKDVLDFHGALKLDAKVSETMSGWKRWALKPVDPFFSREGAGTLVRIQVVGTAKEPKFGRDKN